VAGRCREGLTPCREVQGCVRRRSGRRRGGSSPAAAIPGSSGVVVLLLLGPFSTRRERRAPPFLPFFFLSSDHQSFSFTPPASSALPPPCLLYSNWWRRGPANPKGLGLRVVASISYRRSQLGFSATRPAVFGVRARSHGREAVRARRGRQEQARLAGRCVSTRREARREVRARPCRDAGEARSRAGARRRAAKAEAGGDVRKGKKAWGRR
jgi:hypothetical protein